MIIVIVIILMLPVRLVIKAHSPNTSDFTNMTGLEKKHRMRSPKNMQMYIYKPSSFIYR